VAHTRGALRLAVIVHAEDMRARAQLEALALQQHRIEKHHRARLGVGFAEEALAVSTVLAGREALAIRIGVGVGRVACRQRERLVAEALGGLVEDHARLRDLERTLRKLAAARALERVAAGLEDALDVPGL